MLAAPQDSLPSFLALNLNNLPCIGLNNIDGVSLVCKQTNMQNAIEKILEEQKEMKAKIVFLEGVSSGPAGVQPPPSTETALICTAGARNGTDEIPDDDFSPVISRRQRSVWQRGRSSIDVPNGNIAAPHRQKRDAPFQQRPRRNKPLLTGMKADTTLRAVEAVRKISVFISRCHPDETSDGIKSYVQEIISDECSVQKLPTKFPTYSSFVVTCDAKHDEKIMSPDEWSSGILIRKFYGRLRQNDDQNRIDTRVNNQ